ncbi:efflux transporter outer membrane subunit [Lysobacter sp. SG-8]|uniref:Efflux transporter outer membrane subunit n=1 Tax=Marilutibacter penaei TaxID=2759900 RepID=A0A7W3U2F1_9GAMM|nr:efflux transporter outer membrane subunit [Lysobacter penaei]MBB1087370.1 efflux transporter outer membrane subunit [Lysobacter penaei]
MTRTLRPFTATLLSAALLAGCASTGGLAPAGTLTDPDTLAAGRSLSAHATSDADFPSTAWWTAFGDPQLDALVEEALAGAPSLAVADARLRQATARAGLVDADRMPTVGASAAYSGLRIGETVAPEPLGGSYAGVEMLSLRFEHTFDVWGRKRAEWDAAIGEARAADIDAQAARLTLASQVARTYVALAEAHEALDVAEAEQARAERLQALAGQRVAAGLDNRMQLKRAESAVAAAAEQGQAARQRIDATRNALAALLGRGPDRGLAIERPALLQAPAPRIPALLPSELLGHRPDIVAARWRAEAAQRRIDASETAFYPTVNLTAMVGLASVGLDDLFREEAGLVQGGPAISLPIFDGGRLRAQLDASDAAFDLAAADYNGRLVEALRQVTDALQGARALEQRIATATVARDAAAEAWTMATQRYEAGIGTQLDVLSAQQPLLQLDQQLASLRAQRVVAAIDLDEALGGGLQPLPPDATADAH